MLQIFFDIVVARAERQEQLVGHAVGALSKNGGIALLDLDVAAELRTPEREQVASDLRFVRQVQTHQPF